MNIIHRPGGFLPENAAAPESVWLNRRALIAGMGVGAIALTSGCEAEAAGPPMWLGPAPRNPDFTDAGRPVTPEKIATDHNNFYEFGSHKQIARAAAKLDTSEWTVTIDGEVARPMSFNTDDLIAEMPMEERVIRHRCVEAWSLVVPYIGFPLNALLAKAAPLSSAKYLRIESFSDPEVARNQRQRWYPWPYSETLTLDEAGHPLAFMAMGAYGKLLHAPFGAPIRLHLPWKYGFKSIKSITRITLTEDKPTSFWEELQGDEYGFWANVNPEVPHPRWSQATERDLVTGERIPTKLFNGYAEQVDGLYGDLPKKVGARFWR